MSDLTERLRYGMQPKPYNPHLAGVNADEANALMAEAADRVATRRRNPGRHHVDPRHHRPNRPINSKGNRMTDLTGYAKQGEAYKWDNIGDTLKGEISRVGEIDHDHLSFDKNSTETVLPFTVTNADGDHGVYARLQPYHSLGGAVVDAVTATGGGKLQVGGTIAIRYESDLDTGKGKPAKIYVAQYSPPASGVTLEAPAAAAPPADMLSEDPF